MLMLIITSSSLFESWLAGIAAEKRWSRPTVPYELIPDEVSFSVCYFDLPADKFTLP